MDRVRQSNADSRDKLSELACKSVDRAARRGYGGWRCVASTCTMKARFLVTCIRLGLFPFFAESYILVPCSTPLKPSEFVPINNSTIYCIVFSLNTTWATNITLNLFIHIFWFIDDLSSCHFNGIQKEPEFI